MSKTQFLKMRCKIQDKNDQEIKESKGLRSVQIFKLWKRDVNTATIKILPSGKGRQCTWADEEFGQRDESYKKIQQRGRLEMKNMIS